MGLDHVTDSDTASDLAADIGEALAKVLTEKLGKALKRKCGTFNTSGPLNVARFFQDYIIPVRYMFGSQALEELKTLALATIDDLEHNIFVTKKNNDTAWRSQQRYIREYRKMIESLNNFVD